jgi:predicted glutamine amidotransferase
MRKGAAMCRLYGFLANEPTKVECTLVHAQNALLHQSRADLRGKSHSDGWGISCYPDGTPLCERRATAAHQDLWFSTTAERTYSHAVIAHVRRATVGGPRLENTHPFLHGCWTFAHNGTLSAFDRLEARMRDQTDPALLQLRRGTTDSEQIFYWLLTRIQEAGISLVLPAADHEKLAHLVGEGVLRLAAWCEELGAQPPQLNLLLTDGKRLLASRFNRTLHWVQRNGVHDCEICGIPHIHHNPRADYRAVVVASEPISHEAWREVPNHTVLAFDKNIKPHLLPIDATIA